MPTQAELLQRELDRENWVVRKKKVAPKPSTPGVNHGKAKDALMDELNIKRLKLNQSTDSNQ